MIIYLYNFLVWLIQAYSFILAIYALLSWFPGAYQSGFGRFLANLAEPILRPFRKLPLQFAGMDFTIWAVIIIGQFLIRIITIVFVALLG